MEVGTRPGSEMGERMDALGRQMKELALQMAALSAALTSVASHRSPEPSAMDTQPSSKERGHTIQVPLSALPAALSLQNPRATSSAPPPQASFASVTIPHRDSALESNYSEASMLDHISITAVLEDLDQAIGEPTNLVPSSRQALPMLLSTSGSIAGGGGTALSLSRSATSTTLPG